MVHLLCIALLTVPVWLYWQPTRSLSFATSAVWEENEPGPAEQRTALKHRRTQGCAKLVFVHGTLLLPYKFKAFESDSVKKYIYIYFFLETLLEKWTENVRPVLHRDRTMQKQEYFQAMHLGLLGLTRRNGFWLFKWSKALSSGASKLLIWQCQFETIYGIWILIK